MNKIKVSLDKVSLTELNNRYRDNVDYWIAEQETTFEMKKMEDLICLIGQEGRMFCPATFNGGVKKKRSFEQMQLFPVFFDKLEIDIKEIFNRAGKYGISPNFIYDTFSDDNNKKYTVVFMNETPIHRYEEADLMMEVLLTIFPEADRRSNGVLNVYSGGHKVVYYNLENRTNAGFLYMGLSYYFYETYGINNYKRELIKLSKKTGLKLNLRKLPDITIVNNSAEAVSKLSGEKFDNFSPSCTINNINNGELLSPLLYEVKIINNTDSSSSNNNKKYKKESCKDSFKSIIPSTTVVTCNIEERKNDTSSAENSSVVKRDKNHKLYRSNDLKYFDMNCRLYRDFKDSNTKFSPKELLGIASNLVYVESGEKEFLELLKINIHYENKENFLKRWKYNLFYIKESETLPCSTFCRHHKECLHGQNMLSTVKMKCHQMVSIEGYCPEYVDLEEVWVSFYDNFWEAVESEEKIWHIIKSQTALGKTEALLKFVKETNLRVIIAFPTNKLKREVYERAKAMGIDIIVSPSLHELMDVLPDEVATEIKALYDSGKTPMAYINKLIDEGDLRCSKVLKQYKRELEKFQKSDGHAITTHRRLNTLELSKYDLVIVDEDILYSTVIPNKEEITIKDLKKLKRALNSTDPLAVKIRSILRKRKEEDYFKKNAIKYDKKYDELKTYINIPALCEARYFYYNHDSDIEECDMYDSKEDCINFMRPINFKENVKYIMLSATVNENICKYYFKEKNVRFYQCKEAKTTGTLIQYYNRPMSRSYIKKHTEIYEEIQRKIKVDDYITFMKFIQECGTEWYFGNCVGCDVLKGKDITVIGTPHQPEWIYKLFAYSLGLKTEEVASNITVSHNGKLFRFNTYQNEVLREIQFYMIETELEQAVGRARLLRCDCTVNLFANFPLRQAEMKVFDYNEDENVKKSKKYIKELEQWQNKGNI